jgi:hypothetical protein
MQELVYNYEVKENKKFIVHVIHYSKLTDRRKFFDKIREENIYFNLITEKDITPSYFTRSFIPLNSSETRKRLKAIHLGHASNIFKSRILGNFFIEVVSLFTWIEKLLFKSRRRLNQRLLSTVIYSDKIRQVNLMHALALSKAANGFDYSVILEDDSIFNVDDFYGNVKKTLRFLDGKENSVVFFSEPSAVIFRTIEDVFQFYKGFLRVVPPMSKGASAYMLKRDLALNLSDYILKSKLTLPIDLLINYWAQENKIRTYWKKTPYVTEGSGNIYSSSLR